MVLSSSACEFLSNSLGLLAALYCLSVTYHSDLVNGHLSQYNRPPFPSCNRGRRRGLVCMLVFQPVMFYHQASCSLWRWPLLNLGILTLTVQNHTTPYHNHTTIIAICLNTIKKQKSTKNAYFKLKVTKKTTATLACRLYTP